MINNFKGKNIVQPTGGSRGGWGGKLFGMLRAAPMAQMDLTVFGQKQEKITEEMHKRAVSQSAAKVAGNVIQQRIMGEQAIDQARNVHNFVFEQYDEDHPKVLAGKAKPSDFVYPGYAAKGTPEDVQTLKYGSRAGVEAARARDEIKSREQNAAVAEGAATGGENNTTPPPPGGAAKTKKKKKNNGSPNTTNVTPPKVTPPSATPPWHRG
jgi:hypothetical protein